jgi:hypothetical protein
MNDTETRQSYTRKAIHQKVDRFVILASSGEDLCDIAGPLEAVGRASRLLDTESQGPAGPYAFQICTEKDTSSGNGFEGIIGRIAAMCALCKPSRRSQAR